MEPLRIDHVGIAVNSLDEMRPFYEALGLKSTGIQHIAIRVPDIKAAIAEMQEKGFRMIDNAPRYGAGGASIAFMHPKASAGVLLELTERK